MSMKHKTECGPAYSVLHSTTPKTYMSLASQPQSCRNVAAEADGRDRYHPRFYAASSDGVVRVTARAENQAFYNKAAATVYTRT
jgi:hypothetical protein